MLRHILVPVVFLQYVLAAKQQVQLSDSYLPVAMQVIAHLTDQMAFESRDEPAKPTAKPTPPLNDYTTKPNKPAWPAQTKPPNDYTTKPNKPAWPAQTKPQNVYTTKPNKPAWPAQTRPPNDYTTKPNKPAWPKPTTFKPYVPFFDLIPANGWGMIYGSLARFQTTPFHRPGLFAPASPPKLSHRISPLNAKSGFLPPFDHNSQYTVIEPQERRTEEPLLAIQDEVVKPILEPAKEESLLPPHFEMANRAEDYNEENLQYLSENVRDLIKMAYDTDDERVVDVFEGVRANNKEELPKGKLSASNLRLLLLYDLLSREAKRQKLSDYTGFSSDVMRSLVESGGGGARAQLSLALARMVERKDCAHEYANNRAREMVNELADDNSKLSSEIRYLQPLVYKY